MHVLASDIEIIRTRFPEHIGIIPDGNRRWSEQRGMPKEKGYENGIDPGLLFLNYVSIQVSRRFLITVLPLITPKDQRNKRELLRRPASRL
jgi:undecaprenyl pyrophosphate synthase